MFYRQMDGLAMEGPAYATTAEIYTQAHEKAAILSTLHTPKVWNDLLMIFIPFHLINNLHQNIKFTAKEENNGELALFDTSLKRNNGEKHVLVYSKPTPHTEQS